MNSGTEALKQFMNKSVIAGRIKTSDEDVSWYIEKHTSDNSVCSLDIHKPQANCEA